MTNLKGLTMLIFFFLVKLYNCLFFPRLVLGCDVGYIFIKQHTKSPVVGIRANLKHELNNFTPNDMLGIPPLMK